MNSLLEIGKKRTFKHGVHPKEFKSLSDDCVIERMPFVDEYTLHLRKRF